jgi:hypothetical protein
MKRLLAGLTIAAATATLSGCYYDPGYSYVRSSTYVGDAYYGSGGGTVVYDDGYYAPAYPSYYGGGYYGCCYAPPVSIGISGVWYGGSRWHDRGGRYWDRGGSWRGGHRGGWGGGRGHWDGHRH